MVRTKPAFYPARKSCDHTTTGNRYERSTKALRYLLSASLDPKKSKPVHSELFALESLQSDANLTPQFNKPRKEVHIMWKFDCLEGVVMEAQRFINPHNRHGHPPEHPERRELWMRAIAGQECKFIIHSQWLPVRKGHRVAVLVYEGAVVGLCNLSTMEVINYARTDPVGVWKVRDMLMGLMIGVGAGAYGSGSLPWFAVAALAWLSLLLVRVAQRRRFQRRVDGWLGDLLEYAQGESGRQDCKGGESQVDGRALKYH